MRTIVFGLRNGTSDDSQFSEQYKPGETVEMAIFGNNLRSRPIRFWITDAARCEVSQSSLGVKVNQ